VGLQRHQRGPLALGLRCSGSRGGSVGLPFSRGCGSCGFQLCRSSSGSCRFAHVSEGGAALALRLLRFQRPLRDGDVVIIISNGSPLSSGSAVATSDCGSRGGRARLGGAVGFAPALCSHHHRLVLLLVIALHLVGRRGGRRLAS
jgi:hypothetical protein